MQQTTQLYDNRRCWISAAASQTSGHATTNQPIDDRCYQISNRTKVIYTLIFDSHSNHSARTHSLTSNFRWQDGGVQLLDDLCRQMSQKERRIQVRTHFALHLTFSLFLNAKSKKTHKTRKVHRLVIAHFHRFSISSIQMSKNDEVESIRRHFETLDTFWGRPGKYNLHLHSFQSMAIIYTFLSRFFFLNFLLRSRCAATHQNEAKFEWFTLQNMDVKWIQFERHECEYNINLINKWDFVRLQMYASVDKCCFPLDCRVNELTKY